MKKTSTTASATFDWIPRPSPIMKMEPSTTRGIELAALIKGPSTSARKRLRPRTTPKMTPSATPIRKPRTVSSNVTAICSHKGPCAVPCVTHVTICAQIPAADDHDQEQDAQHVDHNAATAAGSGGRWHSLTLRSGDGLFRLVVYCAHS